MTRRTIMKRRTFISTAAAATATGLAACGSGTPGERADAPEAEGRTTVEFWGNVFTTPENAWYEQIVEDFNAAQEDRSEEHTSELQSRGQLVCRLLLEKKN